MEMTDGQVEVVFYYSSALFAQKEAIKAMQVGTADIHINHMVGEDPGVFILNFFFDLPFLGWSTSENNIKVMYELMDKVPEMKEEFQGLKIYAIGTGSGANWVMSPKKQIQTTEDLKGLKFIAHGYGAKWYEAVGATPVSVSWPDMYTSMEKGVVDASIGAFGPAIGSGMIDLYEYYSVIPTAMDTGFFHHLMNMDSYNSYPPEVKKVLDDLEPWITARLIELEREADVAGVAIAKEKGATFVDISPEVIEEWKALAQPIHEEWIEDAESKGKPARAMFDELMQLLAEYQ